VTFLHDQFLNLNAQAGSIWHKSHNEQSASGFQLSEILGDGSRAERHVAFERQIIIISYWLNYNYVVRFQKQCHSYHQLIPLLPSVDTNINMVKGAVSSLHSVEGLANPEIHGTG
jgi:hypothetical protein